MSPAGSRPSVTDRSHRLGALGRRHHRCKTHSGWTYTMPEAGICLWRSPLGRHYLVDHTGTQTLAGLDRTG